MGGRWAFAILVILLAGCTQSGVGPLTGNPAQEEADQAKTRPGEPQAEHVEAQPPGPHAEQWQLDVSERDGIAPLSVAIDANGPKDAPWEISVLHDIDIQDDGPVPSFLRSNGTRLPARIEALLPAGKYLVTVEFNESMGPGSWALHGLALTVVVVPSVLLFEGTVERSDPLAGPLAGCAASKGSAMFAGHHSLPLALEGWSHELDEPRAIAEFWADGENLGGGSGGIVPAGAQSVRICIDAVAAQQVPYLLTLTAPPPR